MEMKQEVIEQLKSSNSAPKEEYQEEGCPKRLPFGQLHAHEDGCEDRKYVCPIVETGACEWQGPWSELLGHCRAEHPERIIENPHLFRHNITASSVQAYVITVFYALFLVHTKVCTTARKIYHSVRLLGHPEHAACFNFNIDIEMDDSRVMHKGQVAPQGCLDIQEGIAMQVDFDCLLGISRGYHDTTFTLTVVTKCVKCGACVASPMYRDVAGWHCETCTPPRRPCLNSARGCTHIDIREKIRKHSLWYCEHSNNKCVQCNEVCIGSMTAHWTNKHPEYLRGTPWHFTRADNDKFYFVPSDVGVLVCRCTMWPSRFTIHVHSPLSREELRKYECVVVLEHPTTGRNRRLALAVLYHTAHDWGVGISEDEFSHYFQFGETNISIYVKT